eukprot:422025_1
MSDCIFYSQNRCSKGLHCAYRHPPLGATSPCSAWMQGQNCDGMTCGGLHPPLVQQGPGGDTKLMCRFGSRCTKGENCQFKHSGETTSNPPPPLCRFNKQCTRRTTCPYHHTTPTTSPPTTDLSLPTSSQLDGGGSSIRCRFYGQGIRGCTKGVSCPFRHDDVSGNDEDGSSSDEELKSLRSCGPPLSSSQAKENLTRANNILQKHSAVAVATAAGVRQEEVKVRASGVKRRGHSHVNEIDSWNCDDIK